MSTLRVNWNEIVFFFLCAILQFVILGGWFMLNLLSGLSGVKTQWYYSGWFALIIYTIFYLLLERMFKSKIPEKTMFFISLSGLPIAVFFMFLN